MTSGPSSRSIVGRPTRRRAGVFRRTLRREVSRLHDRRRIAAMAILIAIGGLFLALGVARGEAAGADARAYWAGVRIWLGGGDPYHPAGSFMPYVYAPWLLPLFTPWALLPWDVAWFAWRAVNVILLLWTVHWAYRQHPLATAVTLALLSVGLAANIDTGNISLTLVLMLWAAQFAGPRLSGLLWAMATAMKWVPVVFIVVLAPRARLWGVGFLAVGLLLTIATLPTTIVQLQVLFGFQRPARLDYLAFLWAAVPWIWRHWDAIAAVRPADARELLAGGGRRARSGMSAWRDAPMEQADATRRVVGRRVRGFFGLAA